MELTPYQEALLDLYRSRIEFAAAPTIHPVSFPPVSGLPPFETTLLRGELAMEAGEPPLWLYASLGDSARELGASVGHEHQFVGIYESDAVELMRLVAAARHFDMLVEPLDHGHTCPLDAREDSDLRRRGYSHVLLLGIDLYGSMIRTLETAGNADVRGVPTRFLAALPLTEPDMRLKKERGPGAVLEEWAAVGRDPFTVLAAEPR
jgi:hypothetical protein